MALRRPFPQCESQGASGPMRKQSGRSEFVQSGGASIRICHKGFESQAFGTWTWCESYSPNMKISARGSNHSEGFSGKVSSAALEGDFSFV